MTRPAPTSYDLVPYAREAYAYTHPDVLATLATSRTVEPRALFRIKEAPKRRQPQMRLTSCQRPEGDGERLPQVGMPVVMFASSREGEESEFFRLLAAHRDLQHAGWARHYKSRKRGRKRRINPRT